MTKTEIKENIHNLVDSVQDEDKLEEINQIVDFLINKSTFDLDSESEKKSIEEGLEDVKQGRNISYKEFKEKNAKWFEK